MWKFSGYVSGHTSSSDASPLASTSSRVFCSARSGFKVRQERKPSTTWCCGYRVNPRAVVRQSRGTRDKPLRKTLDSISLSYVPRAQAVSIFRRRTGPSSPDGRRGEQALNGSKLAKATCRAPGCLSPINLFGQRLVTLISI